MGRPKKHAGSVRDKLMQVRLQEAEVEIFKKAADIAGLDLSAWVRERLRLIARRELNSSGKR
jgi:hypothetical protein